MTYVGVDVVDELIVYNTARYGASDVQFLERNIDTDPLPERELCLIRQALQAFVQCRYSGDLEKVHQYPHLIVTEHHPDPLVGEPNLDKQPGSGVRILFRVRVYLIKPPFNRPVAELLRVTPREHPNSAIVTFQVHL